MAHRPVKEPLVSVVTAVYNNPLGILECSQALLSQTYQNWEHVIVDDCSTDETPELLRSSNDFRIRPFFQEKNQGPMYAYKRAFDEARGKYVIINDSDDQSTPDRVEKTVKFLEEHPEIDVVYTATYHTTQHNSLPIKVWVYYPTQPFDGKRLEKEQFVQAHITCRRGVLKNFIPDKKYSGSWDWYFLLTLYLNGAKFAPLNEGLYIYNRSKATLSSQHENSGRREESFNNIRRFIRETKRLG